MEEKWPQPKATGYLHVRGEASCVERDKRREESRRGRLRVRSTEKIAVAAGEFDTG